MSSPARSALIGATIGALIVLGMVVFTGCATTQAAVSTVKDCGDKTTHSVALGILDDVASVLVCDAGNTASLPACVVAQLEAIAKRAGWSATDCVIAEIQAKAGRNAMASRDETEFLKSRRATAVMSWRANVGAAAP